MNILPRYRQILTVLVLFLVCSECFPSKHKKAGKHRRTVRSRSKGHGHEKKNTKKDSVRSSNQEVMAAVMHPGKLDMREEKELSQLQDFNREFINNEMAAETSLLANQGIDDDSALRISNIEALPNPSRAAYTASKTKIHDTKDDTETTSKQNVASYNPDEYLLDANSWPEYKIRDSDYTSRNYRVYPQGQNEGEGGFQGGMMPYGERGRAEEGGMEGPYGDGNYGFPQPPQMVSDLPAASQPPDEGSQITMMPMNKVNKVQKLIMKSHKKIKNVAKEKFNDGKTGSLKNSSNKGPLHSSGEGSGSGDGSGASDPNLKVNKAPLNSKGTSNSLKGSNVKSNKKVVGDGKVEGAGVAGTGADAVGKGVAGDAGAAGAGGTIQGGGGGSADGVGTMAAGKTGAKTKGAQSTGVGGTESSATATKSNSDSSQTLTSQAKPEPPAPVADTKPTQSGKETADKTQNLSSNSKGDSSPNKTEPNSSDGPTAKDITNTLSQAQGNSPLGEFAEFLKSKGITLTINKDKNSSSNSNDAQTPAKGDQPSSAASPNTPPESMLASVLPSTGESSAGESSTPATGNTNTPTKTNGSQESQDANLNNAVMHWQNVAPQSGQMGDFFLRHSTKQGHN